MAIYDEPQIEEKKDDNQEIGAKIPELKDTPDESEIEKQNKARADLANQYMPFTAQSAAGPVGSSAGSGGRPIGGSKTAAKAPSSSGAFQDFSKFKQANVEKLKEMQKGVTGQAQQDISGAGEQYGTVKKEALAGISGQGADRAALGDITAQNVAGRAAEIGKTLGGWGEAVTADPYVADVTEAGSTYGQTVQDVTQARDRTGIQSLLGGQRGGGTQGALASDALLLQSTPEFRKALAGVAQTGQTGFEQATGGTMSELEQAAADVTGQRQQAATALRGELGGLSTQILGDVSTASRAAQDQARQAAKQAALEQSKQAFMQRFGETFSPQDVDQAGIQPGAAVIDPGSQADWSSSAYNRGLEALMADPAKFEQATGKSWDDMFGGFAAEEGQRAAQSMTGAGMSAEQAAALNAIAGLRGQGEKMHTASGEISPYEAGGMSSEAMNELMVGLRPDIEKWMYGQGFEASEQVPVSEAPDVTAPVFGYGY